MTNTLGCRKKEVRLYNMILPPFLLFTFSPVMWLVSAVGNFAIDSAVLIILSLIICKKVSGQLYKRTILKVWLLGFASDFIGVIYLLALALLLDPVAFSDYAQSQGVVYAISTGMYYAFNAGYCFYNIWGFLYIFSGVLLAAVAIFLFDYFISFRKTGFTKRQRLLAALTFAVFTAPYTFLLPLNQWMGM